MTGEAHSERGRGGAVGGEGQLRASGCEGNTTTTTTTTSSSRTGARRARRAPRQAGPQASRHTLAAVIWPHRAQSPCVPWLLANSQASDLGNSVPSPLRHRHLLVQARHKTSPSPPLSHSSHSCPSSSCVPILPQSYSNLVPTLPPGHASSPAPRRARVLSATQRRPLSITSYQIAPCCSTASHCPGCSGLCQVNHCRPGGTLPPPLSPQTEPPTRDCLRSAACRLPSAACHCPTLKSCRALPVPLAILPLFQHFAHHGLRKGRPPG
jgi:hypothetical protein